MTSPWVQGIREAHCPDPLFCTFHPDLQGEFFGFGSCIRKTHVHRDYTEFIIALPQIRKDTGLTCQECGGTGEHDVPLRNCIHCHGTGKKIKDDWDTAYLITSNLSLMLNTIEACEETSTTESQLATLSALSQRCEKGSSVSGVFGADLMDVLRTDPKMVSLMLLPNVTDAMITANQHMMGPRWEMGLIGTSLEEGHLAFNSGSEGRGLNLSGTIDEPGRGCRFSSHNIDTPAQALTIIAGIASLVGQLTIHASGQTAATS
ncbi:MAG: hypothetical protein AAB381_00430 [Patescibacteria group bacterium]